MIIKKNIIIFSLLFIIISIITINTTPANAGSNEATKDIAVKDYTWSSSGTGRAAVLKNITLKNTSTKDYKNIEIKIDLYTRAGTPLGTLRGTIKKILPAGSEQTFNNIKLGIMSADLEDSTARVVKAELSGRARFQDPKNLIIIKDWKFEGDNYSTEGFIKEITIENRSDKHFKNINLKISNLGTKGPKVGYEGYVSKITIHKILPAKTTRTFKDINVGFSHPDVTERLITVSDAKIITRKELRYLLAKDNNEKTELAKDLKSSNITIDEKDYEEIDKKLSLAQRYQKKIAENKGEVKVKTLDPEDKNEMNQNISETTEKKKIETIEEYERYLGGDTEEAFPRTDIRVRKFEWGTGVPGTIGVIRKLVLENTSNIPYTKIEIEVVFLTPTGVALSSNKFKIYEMLPPNSTKEFKNVKVGIINSLPNSRDMSIEVVDAQDL
ncbi:MAG: hypothetical protein GTO02_03185 [Candidatus Dadabacteria bacterium]|nr:hypothetical protein [Candidatus Dadabacteria bacterium]NIQ13433.1 hypothetical protein [Candidatus Dadabacteria bacterium]